MKLAMLAVTVAAVAVAVHPALAADPAPDPIRAEAHRRHEALVREGFNLTYGFRLEAGGEARPLRLEIVAPGAGERVLTVWLEVEGGEARVRLLGPGGGVLLEWAGRKGELTVTRLLAAGTYVLEIDRASEVRGEALFGVKGSVVAACPLDRLRVEEVAARPADGFHWPYVLLMPEAPRAGRLLVAPNNTGFSTEDLGMLRASASCEVASGAALAARLGAPLLVPLFPRPVIPGEEENLYIHALSRAALSTREPAWARADLQLLAMIRHARARLLDRGVDAAGRVLLTGFSASGSFVDRFAMLHPDEVLAVAAASPGGWPIAPVAEVEGKTLPYPVGLADLPALVGEAPDLGALRRVRWLFLLGDRDENDAVPYRDSFSAEDEALVLSLFGRTPVERWPAAERLHVGAGLAARFLLVPGVAHEMTAEMREQVAAFLEEAVRAEERR